MVEKKVEGVDFVTPEQLLGADSDAAIPPYVLEDGEGEDWDWLEDEEEEVMSQEELDSIQVRRTTPEEARQLSEWLNSGWKSLLKNSD